MKEDIQKTVNNDGIEILVEDGDVHEDEEESA